MGQWVMTAIVKICEFLNWFYMNVVQPLICWAREAVLVAPTPSDTVGLVNLLGKTLVRYPHNDEALRALLATNPPEPVKDAVYRYVAPR